MLSEVRDWFIAATMGMGVHYDFPPDVSDRDAYPLTYVSLAMAGTPDLSVLAEYGDADVRMATVQIETRALSMDSALAELQRVENALSKKQGDRIVRFSGWSADWTLEGEPVVQATESLTVIYRG